MSRDVSNQICRTCGTFILVGLRDDYCAHIAYVDSEPISTFGEMLARLAGAETYELHRHGEGYRLYARDRWEILGRPAGSLIPTWRVDVLAEHRCGQPWPVIASNFEAKKFTRINLNQPPPF